MNRKYMHALFFVYFLFLVQDVLDFVSWFKPHRSPDISVGITKVRQITFQQISEAAEQTNGESAAAAGGGAGEETTDTTGGHADCLTADCNGCICCTLVQQVVSLPKMQRAEVDAVLEKHGIVIPSTFSKGFAATFAAGASRKRKAAAQRNAPQQSPFVFLMTYKTSM